MEAKFSRLQTPRSSKAVGMCSVSRQVGACGTGGAGVMGGLERLAGLVADATRPSNDPLQQDQVQQASVRPCTPRLSP